MSIHGILQESDYVASQYLHLRPRRAYAITGYVLIAFALLAVAISRDPIIFGILLYLGVYFFVIIPYFSRKNFRTYHAYSEPIDIEIREAGLHSKRTNGEEFIPWNYIHRWRFNQRLFLLYPTGNLFHVIPRHFFADADAFQAFLSTLESKVGAPR